MQENADGFIVPVKNLDACTQCGLCEKVCPVEHPQYRNDEQADVYAAYDPKERKKSSSGGVFYTIARYVIEQGGVVFGAAYDERLHVHHTVATTLEALERLRGSKYVQSHIGSTYREAQDYLRQGKLVYFTGVPCQIAGLKAFLRKDYDHLITSDLVCHGVPSRRLFDQHLRYLEQKHHARVTDYSFRDTKHWVTREKAWFDNHTTHTVYDGNQSPYLYAFGLRSLDRDSCFDCRFARLPRQGDITLADYWGVGRAHPEMNSLGAVSLVLVNSAVGRALWERLRSRLVCKPSTLDDAVRNNPNLVRTSEQPADRSVLLEALRTKPYDEVAESLLVCPPSMQAKGLDTKMKLRESGLYLPVDYGMMFAKRTMATLHIHKIIYKWYENFRKRR
jgi:coenzyme F420-reducing hydrogenase beta subunit